MRFMRRGGMGDWDINPPMPRELQNTLDELFGEGGVVEANLKMNDGTRFTYQQADFCTVELSEVDANHLVRLLAMIGEERGIAWVPIIERITTQLRNRRKDYF